MFPEGRAVELLVAAIVALIVVGPKDLPVLLRKLGQFMAKVRAMAAEFRASFDEMARQSELDELRKEVEAMRQGQLTDIASHAPEVSQALDEINQGLSDVGVQMNAPVTTPVAAPTTLKIKKTPKPRTRKASAAKAPAKATPAMTSATAKTAPKPKAAAKVPTAKPAAKAVPAKPRARKASVS